MKNTAKQNRKSRLQLLKDGIVTATPEEGRKIIPLDLLVEDPRNERKIFRNMDGLISTVKAIGVIEPLTVVPFEDGKYKITTGHRRYRAAKEAGLEQITVIISDGEEEAVRRRKSLISNVQREDIGPVEMAEGLQSLMEEDKSIKTQRDLASIIGKHEVWVSGMLRILTLAPDLQEKLRISKVSVPYDTVMRIARVEGLDNQEKLIDLALEGASAAEIREQIAEMKGKKKKSESVPTKKPKEVISTDHGFTIILQSNSTHEIAKDSKIAGLEQALEEAKNLL